MAAKTPDKETKRKQINVTVPMSEDVFALLRDVSLARHLSGVAQIIDEPIRRRRDELEAETVGTGIKKRKIDLVLRDAALLSMRSIVSMPRLERMRSRASVLRQPGLILSFVEGEAGLLRSNACV